jgi:hypothetical protein
LSDASQTDSPGVIILGDIKPGPLGGGVVGGGSVGGGGTPIAVGPTYTLDGARRTIAFLLLGMLGTIILVEAIGSAVLATECWVFASPQGSCPAAQSSLAVLTTVLGTVFTAMVGLVGSVVGFYFGSQKQP